MEEQEDDREKEQYVESDFKSPEQISNELVTLSLLPNSRWQNLLLDVIKVIFLFSRSKALIISDFGLIAKIRQSLKYFNGRLKKQAEE